MRAEVKVSGLGAVGTVSVFDAFMLAARMASAWIHCILHVMFAL